MSAIMASAQQFVHQLLSDKAAANFLKAVSQQQLSDLTAVLSDPTTGSAAMTVVFILACWFGNVGFSYWSWVDRLWSTLPMLVAAIYAYKSGYDARVMLMTVLVMLWGIRLTHNFWRKGGYGAEEDYRWPILRAWFKANDPIHPVGQEVFNLFFVAAFQPILVWGFVALPLFVAYSVRGTVPLGPLDAAAAAAFLLAFYGEHVTDEAQWAFQTAKYAMTPAARMKAGGDLARGFCTTGPFRYSRHLNFFCEQSMWWSFYGFTIAAGLPAVNFFMVAPIVLSGLFQGSTTMTEDVTVAKYPAYKEYQRTTSRLMPWFPGTPNPKKAA